MFNNSCILNFDPCHYFILQKTRNIRYMNVWYLHWRTRGQSGQGPPCQRAGPVAGRPSRAWAWEEEALTPPQPPQPPPTARRSPGRLEGLRRHSPEPGDSRVFSCSSCGNLVTSAIRERKASAGKGSITENVPMPSRKSIVARNFMKQGHLFTAAFPWHKKVRESSLWQYMHEIRGKVKYSSNLLSEYISNEALVLTRNR